MNLLLLEVIKYIAIPTSLVAIISMITKVVTFTDFDMLFLTKVKNSYLKIWNFLLASTFFFISLLFLAIGFSVTGENPIGILTLISLCLLLLSFFGLLVYYLINKIRYHKTKNTVSYNTGWGKSLFWINFSSVLVFIVSLISILYINTNIHTMDEISVITNETQSDNETQYNKSENELETNKNIVNTLGTSNFFVSIFLIYIFTLFILFAYITFFPKVIYQNKNFFTMRVIAMKDFRDEKLTVLYSLDSETLILGDKPNELDCTRLYHFKITGDTVIEFSRVKE